MYTVIEGVSFEYYLYTLSWTFGLCTRHHYDFKSVSSWQIIFSYTLYAGIFLPCNWHFKTTCTPFVFILP